LDVKNGKNYTSMRREEEVEENEEVEEDEVEELN